MEKFDIALGRGTRIGKVVNGYAKQKKRGKLAYNFMAI